MYVFATGVINDPVEFAIFAYVDTWAGLGGWGGDDDAPSTCTHVTCYALDVSCTCTHVTCYGLDVPCTCTHVTCYASHGEGWVGGKSESKRLSVKFASVSHNKMQFTKRHSKTRLTGTQALDKVWSHLKKHVPKSLCSRSKSDRRFNPRMEQYVYSYMWRFNNRNWWKLLGQLCQQHWQKENTSANEVFFPVLPTSQSKIAKIELRTQFWRVFFTSVIKFRIEKNVGISNDFDMTHVARNANYQGSLTTPVPCFSSMISSRQSSCVWIVFHKNLGQFYCTKLPLDSNTCMLIIWCVDSTSILKKSLTKTSRYATPGVALWQHSWSLAEGWLYCRQSLKLQPSRCQAVAPSWIGNDENKN